jgi:hypothetical protein
MERKMKRLLKTLTGLMFLGFSITGSAAVIVDLYGDKDSFGLGTSLTSGDTFNIAAIPAINTVDAACTDVLLNNPGTLLPCNTPLGTTAFTHTYDLTGLGPIITASLELFTGGAGLFGPTQIYADGNLLGSLTPGETGTSTVIARLDIFDLTMFAAALTGATQLQITTTFVLDTWVLDYSELTLVTADVPEPSVLSLLGLGLIGLGFARRKKLTT